LSKKILEIVSDFASEAHAKIQTDFADINPVIGLNLGMRNVGIPADAITIDCLKTGKRIIIVLDDRQPDVVQYQFSYKAQDPDEKFESLSISDLSILVFYTWMKDYFKT